MINKWHLISLFIATSVTGCADYTKTVGDTVKLAVIGQPDVEIPAQKIAQIPYATAYLKMGKAPRAFVVLAFAENGNMKWVSADKHMLVTRAGRVIKTVGFGEDICYQDNLEHDPLASGLLNITTPVKWQHRVEWSRVYRSGYELLSEFQAKGIEIVTILDKPRSLQRFDEKVSIPALDISYTNQFWLDPLSGKVVQSYQYMGPNLAVVQFTVLKPYAE
ncbi:YjbF family lipoprotein [uncultured Tolumonas sp.]|uniref:YjbF family lipoprotein n=1 Tax=uncultured Tolumonas sp. TaxID=263765 RepID=UPI0029306E5F|nr:YjbF family lipoprotein [uncultured Tolumonas sp.]